jgi:hypothetical protein
MKRILGISAFVACAACGYDWTVGPAPGDGSTGTDGSVVEAGNDAGGFDAEDFDGATCEGLTTEIGIAHLPLIHCMSTCSQLVITECNCGLAVVDATSADAQKYSALTAEYRRRGCTTSTKCSSSCDPPLQICVDGLCA